MLSCTYIWNVRVYIYILYVYNKLIVYHIYVSLLNSIPNNFLFTSKLNEINDYGN